MKKVYKNLFIAIFLILGTSFGDVFAQSISPNYLDGKIWFKVKDNFPVETMYNRKAKIDFQNLDLKSFSYTKHILNKYNLTRLARPYHMVKNEKKLSNVFLLEFADFNHVEEIIQDLIKNKAIEYAEKIPLARHCLVPNDPSYNSSTQWGLFKINAENAWNITTGSASVVVAVVDDAVQLTHPDLNANIWVNTGEIAGNGIDDDGNGYIDDRNGYDVADNDNDPNPPSTAFAHGTHVAGIVGARGNNSTGIASIGYGIKVMAVKSTTTPTLVTNGYDGIVYAVNSGADIINMSWGGSSSSTTAASIITWAWNSGVVLIAAAGNNNVSTMFYPAGYAEVIAVASTSTVDDKSSFSNYGSWIDVSAPGSSIYSTVPMSTYAYMSGTSMASPMVSGLAGLVKSVNPGMTPTDIRNCLTTTADNIDAANPSYIGQLGGGRINAFAAVNCAASTLSLPPQADFYADYTTIPAGASVIFTDISYYSPTSWNWTFTGGTPSSFSGQFPPPIIYNTPGIYPVSLTATNANGSDVMTKTTYINVSVNNGCDTLMDYPWAPVYTPSLYTGGPGNGYVAGTNIYSDRAHGEYYNAAPYTYLTGVYVWFGAAGTPTPSKTLTVTVNDGTGGTVGLTLPGATKTITMSEVMTDVTGNLLTFIEFGSPITLPASKEIFVCVDNTALTFSDGVEFVGMVTTQADEIIPGQGWMRTSAGVWQNYNAFWTGNFNNYINPIVTDVPTLVTFTQSSTNVCAGSSISFDATGSTAEDTLLWTFIGGIPFNSNNTLQTVFFNTPGTYRTYLQVIGGSCNGYAVDSIDITVLPNPAVGVTAVPDTICSGGTSVLTASGHTSYVWSPPTGLSGTTGSTVNSTTVSSITYTVTGTTGTCSRSSSVNVIVDDTPPVANYLTNSDSVCAGGNIIFNGAVSSGSSSYAWTFTGGSIANSTFAGPTVTYATAGTYNVQLIVSNTCSISDTINGTIFVDVCLGNSEVENTLGVAAYNNAETLFLTFDNFIGNVKLNLTNEFGQQIYVTQRLISSAKQLENIDIKNLETGIYFITVTNENKKITYKFFK